MDWYSIFGGNKKSSKKINRNNNRKKNYNKNNIYNINNNYKNINNTNSIIKRNENETELSFKSRKIFLLAASDGNNKKINDELIQLSNIFVNVTILGCTYPSSILKKVYKIADKIKSTNNS